MFESGLEFLRADFHLHTQKDKEFSYSGDISIGVITNHNKFDKDEYKALKRQQVKKKYL